MSQQPEDGDRTLAPRELHLDRLLGRRVLGTNGRPVGRLEEFRAEQHGRHLLMTAYVIGAAGLLERLHVGFKLILGLRGRGFVARWDQIDVTDPERPRLMCAVDELQRL